MRAIVTIALLLFVLIGMAGATIPDPAGGEFGPYGGFWNPKTIQGGYLISDSDTSIGGNLAVTGTATIGGGLTSSGKIRQTWEFDPGYGMIMATGAGFLDLGRTTGGVRFGTGPTYLNKTEINGPVYMGYRATAAKLSVNQTIAGQGLLINDTSFLGGASLINDAKINNTLRVGKSIKASGPLQANYIMDNTSLNVGTTAIVYGASYFGSDNYQNDNYVNNTLRVGKSARIAGPCLFGAVYNNGTSRVTSSSKVGGPLFANYIMDNTSLNVGTTATIYGATNIGSATTLDSVVMNKTVKWGMLAAALTANTTLTTTTMRTVNQVDTTSAKVVVTLPAVALTTGVPLTVMDIVAPTAGNYFAVTPAAGILSITGGSNAGAPGLRTADPGAALTVLSDGTQYQVIGKTGTWAHYP